VIIAHFKNVENSKITQLGLSKLALPAVVGGSAISFAEAIASFTPGQLYTLNVPPHILAGLKNGSLHLSSNTFGLTTSVSNNAGKSASTCCFGLISNAWLQDLLHLVA